jgi:ubiquinone/menaquinone biosynthesis C-methylase UbiE
MRSGWQRLVWLTAALAASAQGPGKHPVTGRVYAGVMGMGGAAWLERAEREREERPQLAVRLLELKPGMVVADIGAGAGYYTELMADRVGARGRIYASEIQSGMVELLRKRVREKKLENVEIVVGSESDPRLPAGALDLALMVDVYHELSQPQEMLRKIREALKPGGRLVLVEFRKEDAAVPIRAEHKLSVEEARAEVEPEGYRLDRVLHELPWQHILVFKR